MGYHRRYADNGRKYEITCVDNEGIPLSVKIKRVGGCSVIGGDQIGSENIPIHIIAACSDDASNYSLKWLD